MDRSNGFISVEGKWKGSMRGDGPKRWGRFHRSVAVLDRIDRNPFAFRGFRAKERVFILNKAVKQDMTFDKMQVHEMNKFIVGGLPCGKTSAKINHILSMEKDGNAGGSVRIVVPLLVLGLDNPGSHLVSGGMPFNFRNIEGFRPPG